MTNIEDFLIDQKAIEDGDWTPLGLGETEVHLLGLPSKVYSDALSKALKEHAQRKYRNDVKRIPDEEVNEITTRKFVEIVVKGVRNLKHGNGTPVTLDEFRALLLEPRGRKLQQAVFDAATELGDRRQSDVAEAVGN